MGELKRLVAGELDRLAVPPEGLLVSDPEAAMARLAQKMGVRSTLDQQQAILVPIEFASPSRSAASRDRDMARVISAVEEIQGEDWLRRLASSTAQAMARRDDEFGAVQQDILLETLRQDFEKPDSQVARFLNFLEDDALARVRMPVSFAIMEAIAHQAGAPFVAPAACTPTCNASRRSLTLYGAPEAEQVLPINLAADYGLDAEFSLGDELVRAHFYGCLPVWAEWNTQLLENRRAAIRVRGGLDHPGRELSLPDQRS